MERNNFDLERIDLERNDHGTKRPDTTIMALDTFTNVSCNTDILMSDLLELEESFPQISGLTLGTNNCSQLLGTLYF